MLQTRPPGPPGHFLVGHLPELRRDMLGLYQRTARDYGDVAMLRFGLKPVYVLSHPDLIEQVLHSRNFIKHYAVRLNRMVLGDGLLSSDGDFWLRQRRLIQPAFLRERILGYAGTMIDLARRWIGRWQEGATRNIHADMRELTMEIAARTLFGAEVEGQGPVVAEALEAIREGFTRRLFSVLRLPEYVPTPGNIRVWRAVRRLDELLYRMIDRRRDDRQDDLLSLLLHARDEHDGAGMSEKQLRDEAMTLFLAGHETTALALTYTLYLLARHPDVQDELHAELRAVLGDGPLTVADLPRLRFTEMVLLEGMRLYPPAYALGRQAAQPCEVGGYHLPAGSSVVMLQWVVHRDPRFWDDPERFHPARWADGLQKRLPKYAYFPFGGGPRICIGNTFALIEATLVLAAICRHWRVSRPAGATEPIPLMPRMTLQPAGPVELVLHKVSG